MRVLYLALGQDLAGQHAAMKAALAVHQPGWEVHQMMGKETYLKYPFELKYNATRARGLYQWADVVHLNSFHAIMRFGPKAVVVHHHGTEYRNKPDHADKYCRRFKATQVAATLDLLGMPGVAWLPGVADLGLMDTHRQRHANGPVVIAHSPTDRKIKGTATVIQAVKELQDRGLAVELDIIEGVSWAESLARKGRADIFVDQLKLGYGMSAVEAWGMGLPVVCGAEPHTRQRYLNTFGSLPYAEATVESLTDVLAGLVRDPDEREALGAVGRAHAEKFHSQKAVADRLTTLYEGMLQ